MRRRLGGAFLVAAVVVDPIAIDHAPGVAEVAEDAAEVFEVIAQLDEGDEIELAEDFGDVMDGGVRRRGSRIYRVAAFNPAGIGPWSPPGARPVM